jgi:hypothetical protein
MRIASRFDLSYAANPKQKGFANHMKIDLVYDVPRDPEKERKRARLEQLLDIYTRPEWKHRNPDKYVNHPDFVEYRKLLRELWK